MSSVLGGAFYVNAGSGPTLSAVVSNLNQVTVTGSGWVGSVAVDLWMDTQDSAHHMAFPTASSTGGVWIILNIGPTYPGPHKIIASQNGGTPVSASFTLTIVQQVDDRTAAALQAVNTGITQIQSSLQGINTKIVDIQSTLSGVAMFDTTSGNQTFTQFTPNLTFNYATIRHVSLAIWVGTIPFPDYVDVIVTVADSGPVYHLAQISSAGVYSYQFDTKEWAISPNFGSSHDVKWNVTTVAPAP